MIPADMIFQDYPDQGLNLNVDLTNLNVDPPPNNLDLGNITPDLVKIQNTKLFLYINQQWNLVTSTLGLINVSVNGDKICMNDYGNIYTLSVGQTIGQTVFSPPAPPFIVKIVSFINNNNVVIYGSPYILNDGNYNGGTLASVYTLSAGTATEIYDKIAIHGCCSYGNIVVIECSNNNIYIGQYNNTNNNYDWVSPDINFTGLTDNIEQENGVVHNGRHYRTWGTCIYNNIVVVYSDQGVYIGIINPDSTIWKNQTLPTTTWTSMKIFGNTIIAGSYDGVYIGNVNDSTGECEWSQQSMPYCTNNGVWSGVDIYGSKAIACQDVVVVNNAVQNGGLYTGVLDNTTGVWTWTKTNNLTISNLNVVYSGVKLSDSISIVYGFDTPLPPTNDNAMVYLTVPVNQSADPPADPPEPVCFLSNTRVQTTDCEHKLITDLREGDYIMSFPEKIPVKIKAIIKQNVEGVEIDRDNLPVKIPKALFGNDTDIFLSGYHRIIFTVNDNELLGVQAFKLPGIEHLTIHEARKVTGEKNLHYYNIELENKSTGLVISNLAVESYQPGVHNL